MKKRTAWLLTALAAAALIAFLGAYFFFRYAGEKRQAGAGRSGSGAGGREAGGMRGTLYIQTDKNVKVHKEKILLGEIADLSCSDRNVLARCQSRTVATLPREKYGRYAMTAMDLVRAVEKTEENLEVIHLGEPEFIIDYEDPGGKSRFLAGVKTALVSLVTFFGTAFSIMTFNTDVDIHGLFSNLHRMFTGQASGGFTILEIMYSVGIGVGVVVFFNHFGRMKISDDPTPMEVQMRIYENQVDDTVLEKERRKETKRRMTAQFLMGLIGFGGGVVAASGAAALVIGLGIIPRYAGISRTPGRILWYEDCAMLGILLGNLTVLWQGEIPLGNVGLAVFGIFAGIFLGSWIIALGEVVDVFAILARRLKLHHSFPWVIAAIAAGKFLGSLLYFGKGWY